MVKIRQNLHRSKSSCLPSATVPAFPAQNQGEGEPPPPPVTQALPVYIPSAPKVFDHPPLVFDEPPPPRTRSTSTVGAINLEKSPRNMSASGRFTRSRLAPDWTIQELFTLACEVAAVEEDCRGTLSVHQRWKIVAEHCAALGVRRTFAQCRRKWNALSSDCRAIARWERSRGPSDGSYWCMEVKRRADLGLPREIDRELFGLVSGALALQEGPVPEEGNSDGGEAAGDGNADEELDVDVTLSQLGFSPKKARATGKDGNFDKDSFPCVKMPEMVKPNKDGKHIIVSGPMTDTDQLSKDGIEGLDVDVTLSQLGLSPKKPRATGKDGNVDKGGLPCATKDGKNSLGSDWMMDIEHQRKDRIEASNSKMRDRVKHQNRKNGCTILISERMQDMVLQLQKNAVQMEAILRGETPEGSSNSYYSDVKDASGEGIGSTRLQADRLLVAVDSLCESIGQFCNIVKEEQPIGS